MRVRDLTVGLSLLASVAGAAAQTPAPTTLATVDAAGRVLTVAAQDGAGRNGEGGALPCSSAVDLPVDTARALILRIATEEKFDSNFVLSVAKMESRYRSTALSEKGAYGLMQLLPVTATRFGVDLCDPEGNVRGGVRYLKELHGRYRNPLFVLAAYNAGEGALRKNRGVPPYAETVRYVADVMNDFYAWPNPAEAAKSAGQVATVGPDFFEPLNADKPLAPIPRPAGAQAAAAPSDGFVMHFQ